jgi:glutamyl-tRNA synthetase
MILGADKKRLSKRHGATSVLAYRDEGFLPEALLNYLVRLGWAYGDQEVFTIEELKKFFDIKDVGKAAAVFNPEKLLWLNGHWIRQASPKRLLEVTKPFLVKLNLNVTDEAYAERALASCQEKVKTLIELAQLAAFYFREDIEVEEKAKQKCFKGNYQDILKKVLTVLTPLKPFDHATIEKALTDLSEQEGMKLGEIAQPLRAALTGSMVSPGIYDVIAVLGKDRVEKRIKSVIASAAKQSS